MSRGQVLSVTARGQEKGCCDEKGPRFIRGGGNIFISSLEESGERSKKKEKNLRSKREGHGLFGQIGALPGEKSVPSCQRKEGRENREKKGKG